MFWKHHGKQNKQSLSLLFHVELIFDLRSKVHQPQGRDHGKYVFMFNIDNAFMAASTTYPMAKSNKSSDECLSLLDFLDSCSN